MESTIVADNCICKFCKKSVTWDNLLPVEISDRLNDLNALRLLTTDLKMETMELFESDSAAAGSERKHISKVDRVQYDRISRAIEENSAKYIDSCCLQLAEKSVELRKENETLALLQQKRKQLQYDLNVKKLIESSLIQNMDRAPQYIRALRFREACSVFKMMSVIADVPPRASNKIKVEKSEILRGVSTIMGLPLLNSGNYEGIPIEIVSSALAFSAHLVDTVACILNIHLDHPLRPFVTFECVASPTFDLSLLLPLTPAVGINTSTTLHLFTPFAAKWRNKTLDDKESIQRKDKPDLNVNSSKKKTGSRNDKMSEKDQDQENSNGNTHEDWMENPSFSVALSLFRANVITLCLRCGIEGSALWPHEAVLLNLDLLSKKCSQEADLNDANSTSFASRFKSSSTLQFPTFHSDFTDHGEDMENHHLPRLIRRYKSPRF